MIDSESDDEYDWPAQPTKRPRSERDFEYRYQGGREEVRKGQKKGQKKGQELNPRQVESEGCLEQVEEAVPEPTCTDTTPELVGEEPTCSAEDTAEQVLDDIEYYVQQLTQASALQALEDHVFVVQEWSNRKLIPRKHVILRRRPMSFDGNVQFMYMCECNKARSAYLDGLPPFVPHVIDAVQSGGPVYNECHHILALKEIAEWIDKQKGMDVQGAFDIVMGAQDSAVESDHQYGVISSDQDTQLFCLSEGPPTACVKAEDGTFGVLVLRPQDGHLQLVCLQCSKKSSTCRHVTVMKRYIDEDEDEIVYYFKESIEKGVEVTTQYLHSCFSKTRIDMFGHLAADLPTLSEDVLPEFSGDCDCHKPWTPGQLEVDELEVWVLETNNMQTVKVFQLRCTDCGSVKSYDGIVDGVLYMNKYLVSLKVLHRYLQLFVSEGITMYSFYKMWRWDQLENDHFTDVMTYTRFRSAWYAFIDLLDLNMLETFSCPTCGPQPATVVMDGITLGLRRALMPHIVPAPASEDQLDGSSHSMRTFVNSKSCRELLGRYSAGKLKKNEFNDLLKAVRLYKPALVPLIIEFEEREYFESPPDCYKPVLRALSKSYPACALVHPGQELRELLERMSNGHDTLIPSEMRLLQHQVPVLFDLITCEGTVSHLLAPILTEMVRVSQEPFRNEQHELPACNDPNKLGHFPSLPQRVQRGRYVLDSARLRTELTIDCDKGKLMSKKKGHATLVPGIFTLLCLHGVCYGFQIMQNCESPDVPFTILRTRFEKAPSMVIYDNACNLHSYCLNRDPVFFEETWFVVDRFHWKNHRGCSEGYHLTRYPQFSNINTQVAEQRNSSLVKLKSMLSYMNFENFVRNCKLYLWFRNMLAIASSNPNCELQYMKYFAKLTKK